MELYDVFVAFVGLNNITIVYAQYRIWIGLIWPIPDPQKMTGSEPIPILSIGSMHRAGLECCMTETPWDWKWLCRMSMLLHFWWNITKTTFSFGKITSESCKQGTCIKTGVNLDVMSTSSALRETYLCELMGDRRCWWDKHGIISKHAALRAAFN